MYTTKTAVCRDHHHFTECITNFLVELPRRTPVDNGTDIYVDDIVISIRLPLLYSIVTLTDKESTKIILPSIYKALAKASDKFIENYSESGFYTVQTYAAKYQNSNKIYSTKITADIDDFLRYMERELKFAESKAEKVLDYSKDDLCISMREYRPDPAYCRLHITYIQKKDNPYFEMTVLETNGLSKHLREADKTPTKVKIEELINRYFNNSISE